MLFDYIKEAMLNYPEKTISDKYHSITFMDFLYSAEFFARQLKGKGKIAILCESELDTAKYILACLAAGVTAIPMSQRYGCNNIEKIITKTQPEYIITCADSGVCLRKQYSCRSLPDISNKNTFIMCTSGTSGSPKAAVMTDEGVNATIMAVEKYFNVNDKDTILISRPLYHSAVLNGEFFTAIRKGMNIVFTSDPFDYNEIIRIIKTYKITVFCGTPTILYYLCKITSRTGILNSLRSVVCSGECMTEKAASVIRKALPTADIYNVYGLTEAGPRVSYLPPEKFDNYWDTVGIPVSGTMLKIKDGELLVKSKSIMKEYYNEKKLTDKILCGGWLHTGDCAEFSSGFLKIIGRKDDVIIKGGMNIYPSEIEDVIANNSNIRAALVYGMKGDGVTQKIYLKAESDSMTVSDIMLVCRKHLAPYQIPDYIEVVHNLPHNASGKIIRPKK